MKTHFKEPINGVEATLKVNKHEKKICFTRVKNSKQIMGFWRKLSFNKLFWKKKFWKRLNLLNMMKDDEDMRKKKREEREDDEK
ncbi:hypothetical protein MTR_5g023080 [Medicago truncatula]|uniref:Uncharacterized protein n=1 Tax=Medicago truncatula TaxID=3880 RepID=G7JYS3_MEDTR|nr:hypothetical protein MTR_5g023080 [Medicago truncatula]